MSSPESLGSGVPGTYIHRTRRYTDDVLDDEHKLVVVMVGLPARGKSYIVKKLKRYLNWLGFSTRIFNVGNRRRTVARRQSQQMPTSHTSQFFDPDNREARAIRDQLAMDSLDELIIWLQRDGGHVAIHDATNSNRARRAMILERCQREPHISVLFVESICDDQQVLRHNIRMKLMSPDYMLIDPATARKDFLARLRNYERAYQTIGTWEEKRDVQYCKIINVGKKVIANNIQGYLAGQCVFYLMNMNLARRQIWITRHGESEDNLSGRIGGDAPLSEAGRIYAQALTNFISEQRSKFETSLQTTSNSPLLVGSESTTPKDNPSTSPSLAEVNATLLAQQSNPISDVLTTNGHKELSQLNEPSWLSHSSSPPTPPFPPVQPTVQGNGPHRGVSMSNGGARGQPSDPASSHLPPSCMVLPNVSRSSSLLNRGSPVPKFIVWTSMLKRTIETVEGFDPVLYDIKHIRALNEIYAGSCEGMTYQEIQKQFPQEFAARQINKLYYRYPGMGGESYADVIQRLHPLIVELERTTHSALIVTHNAMSRTLLAYMLDIPTTEMTRMEVPLHTVYCLEPKPFGNECRKYQFSFETGQFHLVD
ncbi:Fructose-2,6-bisphosphatase [Dispira simplex]|nr:Fructose-2,6-bisphosphatase [Dispira simplex]